MRTTLTIFMLRWIARVATLFIWAFFMFFFIADLMDAWVHHTYTNTERKDIVILSFIFLTLFSYVLAWKKELLGGMMGLTAYLINARFNHQLLHRIFWIAPSVGLLYIVTDLLDRYHKKKLN